MTPAQYCDDCGTELIFLGRNRSGAEYFCPNFKRHAPRPIAPDIPRTGAVLIAEERVRQISAEGWTPTHDDEHDDGELALAAVSYTLAAYDPEDLSDAEVWWPWDESWWKPRDPIRNLVRAGALIAAEIDRLQRKATLK